MAKRPSSSFRPVVCRFPLRIAQELTHSLKPRRGDAILNPPESRDRTIDWIGTPGYIARLSIFW